jgi:hypothetical protein
METRSSGGSVSPVGGARRNLRYRAEFTLMEAATEPALPEAPPTRPAVAILRRKTDSIVRRTATS